jgi:hypothetical protein
MQYNPSDGNYCDYCVLSLVRVAWFRLLTVYHMIALYVPFSSAFALTMPNKHPNTASKAQYMQAMQCDYNLQ